jgi:hypothetical protein
VVASHRDSNPSTALANICYQCFSSHGRERRDHQQPTPARSHGYGSEEDREAFHESEDHHQGEEDDDPPFNQEACKVGLRVGRTPQTGLEKTTRKAGRN